MLIRPTDGALIVSEFPQFGVPDSLDLHVITLNGSAVASDTLIHLGMTAAFEADSPQCALLTNGDVLVALRRVVSGPLGGHRLGLVSPASGTVTPVPIHPSPDTVNAVAVNAAGTTAYVGVALGVNGQGGSRILVVPLPQGGAATRLANLPEVVSSLAFDNSGQLLAATFLGPNSLYSINPSTGVVNVVPTLTGGINAIGVESATGNIAVGTAFDGTPAFSVFTVAPNGTSVFLTSGPLGGWGGLAGIDANL